MMPKAYLDLANERVNTRWPGYAQPEDFGYDFREWVSPYTKGAHTLGGIAVVLQDWSSSDTLRAPIDPSIQEHGRTLGLRTNRILEALLLRLFGATLADVYATNAFPFIKQGGISKGIPRSDVIAAARLFTRHAENSTFASRRWSSLWERHRITPSAPPASIATSCRIPPRELARSTHTSGFGAELSDAAFGRAVTPNER
jgi:hypothetical protein